MALSLPPRNRFRNSVSTMSSRWWPSAIARDAVLRRVAIQRAAPHARAQAAHGAAFGYQPLHHAVGVLLDDVEVHAQRAQVVRQHMRREVRLLLVQVHGDQREVHRRSCAAATAACPAACRNPCRRTGRPSRGRLRRSSRSPRSPCRPGRAAAPAACAWWQKASAAPLHRGAFMGAHRASSRYLPSR